MFRTRWDLIMDASPVNYWRLLCVHICFSSPEGFGIRFEEGTFLQSYFTWSFKAWSMFHVCGDLDSTKFSPSVCQSKSKYSTYHHNREFYLFWDNFEQIERHRNNKELQSYQKFIMYFKLMCQMVKRCRRDGIGQKLILARRNFLLFSLGLC